MTKFEKMLVRSGSIGGILFAMAITLALLSLLDLPRPLQILVIFPIVYGVVLLSYHWMLTPLRRAVRALDEDGDPEPMLAISNDYLQTGFGKAKATVFRINRALALHYMGQNQDAIAEMLAIPNAGEDKDRARCFLYANNLSAMLAHQNDLEASLAWNARALDAFGSIPERKKTPAMREAIVFLSASEAYCRGHFEESLRHLDSIAPQTRLFRVDHAFWRGKALLALGRTAEASEAFRFVCENSGKLFHAHQAKVLLASCQ